ncbi:hypothetical protein CAEBREN_08601 [Caenorhabditis brenneri]|uniref:TATA-box-binding protein n=1 Tax=Caenorhabditis brenneri TaxID=135651 RepID=G0PNI4_CAEBE|nr:hypothetical protein CAEBREN_08601 [Caenorhabditis brenneri]
MLASNNSFTDPPLENSNLVLGGKRLEELSSSLLDVPIPIIENVVSTISLGVPLDLEKIALNGRNIEYNPSRFGAAIMRIRNPRTTGLIFSSGKIVCAGAKSEESCRRASRKYARIVEKLGYQAKSVVFEIQNIVATCNVRFSINLGGISFTHLKFCTFEPEIFPGLHYRMLQPKVTIVIFPSGKLNITGAKNKEDIDTAFRHIYPILRKC